MRKQHGGEADAQYCHVLQDSDVQWWWRVLQRSSCRPSCKKWSFLHFTVTTPVFGGKIMLSCTVSCSLFLGLPDLTSRRNFLVILWRVFLMLSRGCLSSSSGYLVFFALFVKRSSMLLASPLTDKCNLTISAFSAAKRLARFSDLFR